MIELVVHTNGRTKFLRECLNSLAYNNEEFSFILSDNSVEGLNHEWIEFHPKLKYRRVTNCVSWNEHFNNTLKLNKEKYLMLFHDDDVFIPDFFEVLPQLINHYPDNSFAVNAKLLFNIQKSNTLVFDIAEEFLTERLYSKKVLNNEYIGFPPISFFIWKADSIFDSLFTLNMGKYSDIEFVYDNISKTAVKIIKKPLGYYRVHGMQGSKSQNPSDQLLLLDFLSKSSRNKEQMQFRARIAVENRDLSLLRSGSLASSVKLFLFFFLSFSIKAFRRIRYFLSYRIA